MKSGSVTNKSGAYFIGAFLIVSGIVGVVVWSVARALVDDDAWRSVESILILSGAGVYVIALLMGGILRHYLKDRIDFLKHTLADAMTGEERLRVLPDDDFASLSFEIAAAIEQHRERLAMLEQETDQLATLLSSMAEAVIMTNEHERVLLANPRAVELFDLVPATSDALNDSLWCGKRLSELTSYHSLTDIASDVLWRGKARIDEIVYQDDQKGDNFFYSISTSPINNHDDHTVGVVIVLYDITRLRRLERVRRDFVANVSHELRTPIASIRSSAETILLPEMHLPDCASSFGKAILRNADRMSCIIEDLLTLSRLEEEGESRSETNVSLPSVFAEVLDRCAGLARKGGLILEIELPDEIPEIRGEHRPLCQVLFNLVENAIKYTPSGGRVTLDATCEGDEVAIRVTDDGAGIPVEHLPRIFERFYRVDEGRSRDVGGTGLGLAIVKHTVRLMGGRIAVTSRPGETRFTVYLKAYEPLAGEFFPPSSQPQ